MNKETVIKYINTGDVSEDVSDLYFTAERLVKAIGDTLCEDFQIVSSIVDVFENRARMKGYQ